MKLRSKVVLLSVCVFAVFGSADSAIRRAGVREFDDVSAITTDRHAVFQILINPPINTRYALVDDNPDRELVTVRLRHDEQHEGYLRIDVIDNGVGIAEENLTRIFVHRLTTRPEWHGFGFDAGSMSAKNLCGSLTVQSYGIGQGATFHLQLPLVGVKA